MYFDESFRKFIFDLEPLFSSGPRNSFVVKLFYFICQISTIIHMIMSYKITGDFSTDKPLCMYLAFVFEFQRSLGTIFFHSYIIYLEIAFMM